MAVYFYQAKKQTGELVKGRLEALSRQEVLESLDQLGFFPLSITEGKNLKIISKVSQKELVEFTHQLATLVNSGAGLVPSLNTLVNDAEYGSLKPVISDIINEVKEGRDFSQALKKYPHIFSGFYVSLVRMGEASGTLTESLRRLGVFLEEELDFKDNMLSLMIYPLFVVGVGVATIFVLLKFVIPMVVNIFKEMDQALPVITQIFVNISQVFSRYWLLVTLAIASAVFIAKKYFENPSNKIKWDDFKIKLPLVGDLLVKIEICRFSRTLAMLLGSGMPADVSLNILADTITNFSFRREIMTVNEEIKQGSSLSQAMKIRKKFPPSFINVVTVGEESGRLDKVLQELAYDYNKEVDRRIKRLLNMLGPVLILIVGLLVFLVVLSMLLPILQIDFNF